MTPDEYTQRIHNVIAEVRGTVFDSPAYDAVQRMLEPHREFRIYDECDHEHQPISWTDDGSPVFAPGVVEVEDIGMTCNHAYSVCRQCCTDQQHGGDWYQREDCANAHNAIGTAPCWPCQPWLAAGDALSIPRPETQNRRR